MAADIDGFLQGQLDDARPLGPDDLLAWWRSGRDGPGRRAAAADPAAKIPWYGPPMSPASFATARLMETFAHGQDVVDGLRAAGVRRPPRADRPAAPRLPPRRPHPRVLPRRCTTSRYPRRTSGWSSRRPTAASGPGATADVADRLTGPALDFALLATQRRHLDDLALRAEGPVATQWLPIVQAFAGPPGAGRAPGMGPA